VGGADCIDWGRALGAAKAAAIRWHARRWPGGFCRADAEDMAGDIILERCRDSVVRPHIKWTRRRYAWAANASGRRTWGEAKFRGKAIYREVLLDEPGDLESVSDSLRRAPDHERIVIALCRLQQVWPELTELQRVAVRCHLGAESTSVAAKRHGSSRRSLTNMWQDVRKRL